MKLISACIICLLMASCNHADLGTAYKDENGFFVATIVATSKSETPCENETPFDSPPNFSMASYGRKKNDSLFPKHPVFIFDSSGECSEIEAFFPVGLITLTNHKTTKSVTIGLPIDPKATPEEITTFFYFQVNYVEQIQLTTDWIENNLGKEWLVTGWQDEIAARANLEKIIRGF